MDDQNRLMDFAAPRLSEAIPTPAPQPSQQAAMPRYSQLVLGGGDQGGKLEQTAGDIPKYSRLVLGGDVNFDSPESRANRDSWTKGIRAIPGRIVDAVKGTHDPAYKDVPAFDQRPESTGSANLAGAMTMGMVGGADDAGYGDIIEKKLGPKFIRRFKDANGYDLVEHVGDDGKSMTSYVNKPGLDKSDITRGIVGAVPYIAGGAVAGLGKLGLMARTAAQGTAAGATSIVGDGFAASAGSDQGIDLTKAAVTGATAGAATLAAPAVGALWRKFVTEPRLFDKAAGKLTAEGEKAAASAGLNPADLEAKVSEEFAKTYAMTGDAAQSAVKAQTGAMGIETSLAQRTNDAQQAFREKNMTNGVYGDSPAAEMKSFADRQRQQVESAVVGDRAPAYGQALKNRSQTTLADVGETIQSGVQSSKAGAKAGEKTAWDQVGDLTPKPEAFADLAPTISAKLGKQRISSSTPQAMEMDAALADFADGKAVASGTKLIQQAPAETIDDMRRHLKDMLFAVKPENRADRAAAQSVYDGFNDWVGVASKKSLLNGDPTTAAKMIAARDTTKVMHEIFSPTTSQFKATPAGRMIGKILEGADSPENIVNMLFSGPTRSQPKEGTVMALNSIKRGLEAYADTKVAAETWTALQAAHYSKLVMNRTGELLSPQVMRDNIKAAFASQETILRTMYNPQELRHLRQLQGALDGLVVKDINPSGTATGAALLIKEFMGKIMDTLPTAAKVAVEFSGLPKRFSSASAAVSARAATSQTPQAVNPLLGGYAGATGNQLYRQ
jgi:hypothetical protein